MSTPARTIPAQVFRFGDSVIHPTYGECMFLAYLNEYQCQLAGWVQSSPEKPRRQVNPIVPIVSLSAGGKAGMSFSPSRHA